jgi:hypothetical protein
MNAHTDAAPVTDVAGRLGFWSGVLLLVALPLSGPLGTLIAGAIAPQPPWVDAATFMRHHHAVQGLPFMVGFLLLVGFPGLQVALHFRAPPAARPFTLLGVVFAAVFAALIAFNYLAQTALVPAAVARGDGALVALLSMNSPSAICWAIEMFGYGFLGLASLCALPALPGGGVRRVSRLLLWANGLISVAGAALTARDSRWVLTPAGLVAFLAWNAVILGMVLALVLALRGRAAQR